MPVWAAEYEVEVRVTVERGCQLIGSTRNAGIESLGVLDFGRISRLDSGSGPLNAALLNQRVPRLECNPDTTYQLQIDGGQHGGTGDVRYLANGPRALPIPYRIYRDAARLVPLPSMCPWRARCRAAVLWRCRCMRALSRSNRCLPPVIIPTC